VSKDEWEQAFLPRSKRYTIPIMKRTLTRPLILLLLTFLCIFAVLSYLGALPTYQWYSALTQRPQLRDFAQKIGIRQEQFLSGGTIYNG
jgi:hypothetical protein